MSVQDELDSLIEKLSSIGSDPSVKGAETDSKAATGSSVPTPRPPRSSVVQPFRPGAALSAGSTQRGDAIDMVLNAPARQTAVASLRDAPEVTAFRDELVNGLIRVDTANQLLRLVNEVITRLL